MEVSALGLRVDSDQVAKAADQLERLTDSSRRAEAAAGGVGKGSDAASRSINQMEAASRRSATSMANLAQMAARAGLALGAAFSLRALQQYADGWSDMQSVVGAAIKDMEAAPAVMRRIVNVANASYSPLQQTVDTFARNVTVLREMGRTSAEAADFTESLNNALVITATRGQRATSVQEALSRAMAVGRLQTQQLETILASGGRVAEALANELGTTVNGLRGLASEGKITSDVIANALIGSLDDLRAEAAAMPATMSDAFTRIQNNVTELIGRLDQASGASSAMADGLLRFADGIRTAGDYALRFVQLAAPAFDAVSGALGAVFQHADVALVALGGFAAPALVGGVWALTVALGTGLVGAIRAVTAAMLANPIGAIAAILAGAVYAVYRYRDAFANVFGIDIPNVARSAANTLAEYLMKAAVTLKFEYENLSDSIGAAFVAMVNGAIGAIRALVTASTLGIDLMIRQYNRIPGVTAVRELSERFAPDYLDNPYADRLRDSMARRDKELEGLSGRDFVAEAADRIRNALARLTPVVEDDAEAQEERNKILAAGTAASDGAATAAGRLLDQIRDRANALMIEARSHEFATEAQKELAEFEQLLAQTRDKSLIQGAALIRQRYQELDALEQSVNALKMDRQLREEWITSLDDQIEALYEQNFELEDQIKHYGMAESWVMRLAGAQAREAASALQSARARAILNGETAESIAQYDEEIAKLLDLSDARHLVANSLEEIESREAWEAYEDAGRRANEEIGRTLTDALMRGFEDGAGFAQNFRRTLINMFRTMVLRPLIEPVVQQASGVLTNALGMSGGPGGGMPGVPGGGNFLGSIAGRLTNMSAAMGAGASAGSVGFANAVGSVGGDALGALIAGNPAWAKGGSALLSGAGAALGMVSKALPWVGVGLTAYSLLKDMFDGETRFGAGYMVDPATGAAMRTGGPSGGDSDASASITAIEDVWSTTAQMAALLGGSLSGLSFGAGSELSPEKGNSFVWSSWGRTPEEVSHTDGMRALPGVTDGSVVAQEFAVELQRAVIRGLQMSDLDDHWRDWIDQFDVSQLDAQGVQSVVEMISALVQLRDLATSMGMAQLAEATAQAQQNIINFSGGIDALSANLTGYYENFFSEAERHENLTNNLTRALQEMGYELPRTRDGFRALVEAQDPATEAGQRNIAMLLSLQGAFAQLTEAAHDANMSLEDVVRQMQEYDRAVWDSAVNSANAAMDTFSRAIAAERRELQQQHSAAMSGYRSSLADVRSSMAGLASLADTLANGLAAMRLESMEYDQLRQAGARRQIQSALAMARAGESLMGLDLAPALSELASMDTRAYANWEDYAEDWARTANELAELQEITEAQLSVEERIARNLEQRMEQAARAHEQAMAKLDELEAEMQEQLDALLGIADGVLPLPEALLALTQALAALAGTPRPAGSPSDTPNPSSLVQGWYTDTLGRAADAAGEAYWQQEIERVGAVSAYQAFREAAERSGEVPRFATGGIASGWAIVGEHGPELANFTDPARVYSAQQTARMFAPAANDWAARSSSEMTQLIVGLMRNFDTLNAEVKSLHAVSQATAVRVASMDKTLQRIQTPGGNGIRVEVAA